MYEVCSTCVSTILPMFLNTGVWASQAPNSHRPDRKYSFSWKNPRIQCVCNPVREHARNGRYHYVSGMFTTSHMYCMVISYNYLHVYVNRETDGAGKDKMFFPTNDQRVTQSLVEKAYAIKAIKEAVGISRSITLFVLLTFLLFC